jgi:hypothetical protein
MPQSALTVILIALIKVLEHLHCHDQGAADEALKFSISRY